VLTTGFDVPDVDLIALVRNTKSPVLYVQIAGRGMRISQGKTDCLWCDFTDTTALLGPVDEVRGRAAPKPRDDDERVAPTKICDHCGASNPAGVLRCVQCDAAFPPPSSTVNGFASQAAVLSGKPRLEQMAVDEVTWNSATSKKTAMPYLVIQFRCDFSTYRMPLFLDNDGYARQKALTLWQRLVIGPKLPVSVGTAVEWLQSGVARVRPVSSITVDVASKWQDIVSFDVQREVA
jgi:DNA repair protein RadD